MPTVDTNVLLRWLLGDVPEQAAAADALLSSGIRHVAPDVALIETAYVLERVMLFSRSTVADSIDTILAVASLDLDRSLWRTAVDNYRGHPKLSIADTFLTAQANATKRAPLRTFDKKLARQLDGAELVR